MEDKAGKKKSYAGGPIAGLADTSEGELDQQLVSYAYNTAIIAVVSMVGDAE